MTRFSQLCTALFVTSTLLSAAAVAREPNEPPRREDRRERPPRDRREDRREDREDRQQDRSGPAMGTMIGRTTKHAPGTDSEATGKIANDDRIPTPDWPAPSSPYSLNAIPPTPIRGCRPLAACSIRTASTVRPRAPARWSCLSRFARHSGRGRSARRCHTSLSRTRRCQRDHRRLQRARIEQRLGQLGLRFRQRQRQQRPRG